jgi:hypothetical protein
MFATSITAVVAMCILLSAWLAILFISGRCGGRPASEDPLAGRIGCHGCLCTSRCADSANAHAEEDCSTNRASTIVDANEFGSAKRESEDSHLNEGTLT